MPVEELETAASRAVVPGVQAGFGELRGPGLFLGPAGSR